MLFYQNTSIRQYAIPQTNLSLIIKRFFPKITIPLLNEKTEVKIPKNPFIFNAVPLLNNSSLTLYEMSIIIIKPIEEFGDTTLPRFIKNEAVHGI